MIAELVKLTPKQIEYLTQRNKRLGEPRVLEQLTAAQRERFTQGTWTKSWTKSKAALQEAHDLAARKPQGLVLGELVEHLVGDRVVHLACAAVARR